MTSILQSLSKTIHVSLALSILLFLGLYFGNGGFDFDLLFWSWLFRYIHVVVAIMWIGLLWYFNFVQIPNMPKIPDDQNPAIGKVIVPIPEKASITLVDLGELIKFLIIYWIAF